MTCEHFHNVFLEILYLIFLFRACLKFDLLSKNREKLDMWYLKRTDSGRAIPHHKVPVKRKKSNLWGKVSKKSSLILPKSFISWKEVVPYTLNWHTGRTNKDYQPKLHGILENKILYQFYKFKSGWNHTFRILVKIVKMMVKTCGLDFKKKKKKKKIVWGWYVPSLKLLSWKVWAAFFFKDVPLFSSENARNVDLVNFRGQ